MILLRSSNQKNSFHVHQFQHENLLTNNERRKKKTVMPKDKRYTAENPTIFEQSIDGIDGIDGITTLVNVEPPEHNAGIFASVFSRPGINIIHDVIKPASRIKPYAIRVDVEPLHDGHAAQQSEQNALPKQQATVEPNEPRQRPICAIFRSKERKFSSKLFQMQREKKRSRMNKTNKSKEFFLLLNTREKSIQSRYIFWFFFFAI